MKYRWPAAIFFLLVACGESNAPQQTSTVTESSTAATATPQTDSSPTASNTATTTASSDVSSTAEREAIVRCTPAADRLCPSDEGASDPSFAAFRDRLREAVKQKNEKALLSLLDSKIRTTFGDGDGGVEAFRKQWNSASADSKLWPELDSLLTMGGSFLGEGKERSFWAPYVYSNWPEAVDSFEHVVAIRNGVIIRKTPEASSAQVSGVDYAILRLVPDPRSGKEWRKVETRDGKSGWVRGADVRSPIDYRAGFSRRTGEWKMDALVAGD
jgi:hypothetical protein